MYRLEYLNEKSFTLNGIPYTKVYQLRYSNNLFSLVNIYDKTDVLFNDGNLQNISIKGKQFTKTSVIFKAFETLK